MGIFQMVQAKMTRCNLENILLITKSEAHKDISFITVILDKNDLNVSKFRPQILQRLFDASMFYHSEYYLIIWRLKVFKFKNNSGNPKNFSHKILKVK